MNNTAGMMTLMSRLMSWLKVFLAWFLAEEKELPSPDLNQKNRKIMMETFNLIEGIEDKEAIDSIKNDLLEQARAISRKEEELRFVRMIAESHPADETTIARLSLEITEMVSFQESRLKTAEKVFGKKVDPGQGFTFYLGQACGKNKKLL